MLCLARSADLDGLRLQSDRLVRRLGRPGRQVSAAVHLLTGGNVSPYINRLRIDEARTLLCDTTFSLTEIQLVAGYQTATRAPE